MRILLSILIIPLFNFFAKAQTTAILDPNFEQVLINLGYDNVIDGSVLTSNINTIDSLNVGFNNIADLTGIQDFTLLTYLSCGFNQLSSLDVSQNLNLEQLFCWDNQLTSLIVLSNTLLKNLNCNGNQITNLDISQNTLLTKLDCGVNQLTNLNLTQNINLVEIDCYTNMITNLNVTQNLALEFLSFYTNPISSINLTQNSNLIGLACLGTQLSSLNISVNANLTMLGCSDNPLLSCLNVKNGNNINFNNFVALNCPNLTCIEVDNAAWSSTNWTFIDPQTSFSISCPNPCTVGIEENNLSNITLFPNPTTGAISIDLGELKTNLTTTLTNSLGQIIFTQQYETTDFINLNIADPKGIYFLQLESEGEITTQKIVKK